MTDLSFIDNAFPASQNDLKSALRSIAVSSPQSVPTLQSLSDYVLGLRRQLGEVEEPASKKRKLDAVVAKTEETNGSGASLGTSPVLQVTDISFSVPQRKKFSIGIFREGVQILAGQGGEGAKIEAEIRFKDIKLAVCLPVPEKAQRQFNFVLVPKGAEGLRENSPDAWVFTIPDGAPKNVSGPGLEQVPDEAKTTLKDLLISVFKSLRLRVEEPNPATFKSTIPQPQRKGEPAFHIKAHRGSKDGYLFFLQSGILFGFKKPLSFFEHAYIQSISYTSITKRTFNLNIHTGGHDDIPEKEHEFAMIDQADHQSIDEYVRRYRLQDASMAESRRAKKENVNGEEEDGAQPDTSELEKAMQDAEDEEEEDYDPDAEESGDEDGSGDSDDTDSELEDDEEDDFEGDVDVNEELGSELEDVGEDGEQTKRSKRIRRS